MHGSMTKKLRGRHMTGETAEDVGRRLKELRLGLKLSQQAMTRVLGYTSPRGQTWNNFETGGKMLTMDAYNRIRKQWGVPFTWVFLGKNSDLTDDMRRVIARGKAMAAEQDSLGIRHRFSL